MAHAWYLESMYKADSANYSLHNAKRYLLLISYWFIIKNYENCNKLLVNINALVNF